MVSRSHDAFVEKIMEKLSVELRSEIEYLTAHFLLL